MILFLLAILSVSAKPLEAYGIPLKYYTVIDEAVDDKQWMIEGVEGWYFCTAETSCKGVANETKFITGREVWYDPILVFYEKDNKRHRCMLTSCVRPRPLTYEDL